MTAEVGIMNQLGVALAADSAVTLGGLPNKVYQSAEKLFLLAERAPVGAMTYGNANFMGYPWETIVKEYRRTLGPGTFDSLAEYVENLLCFLSGNRILFPHSAQETFVRDSARIYYWYVLCEIKKRLNSDLAESSDRSLTGKDIRTAISAVVRQEMRATRDNELADGLPSDFPDLIKKTYGDAIRSEVGRSFGNLPMTRATRARLVDCTVELIARKCWKPAQSGLVVAGFGENEYYPSAVDLTMEGIAADHLIFSKERERAINDKTAAYVIPFAQREMVSTFMEGIDPDLRQAIETSTSSLFRDASKLILEELERDCVGVDKELQRRIFHSLDSALTNLIHEWNEVRKKNYWSPVMSIVASLPKDELAAMAEALVNLTKFKRRVSLQEETVAGPIDVAVITKGDGFIWIKRKYYFQAELNPRFMSRYNKEVNDDGTKGTAVQDR